MDTKTKISNRITQLFDTGKKDVLNIYFTAGFPELNDMVTIIKDRVEHMMKKDMTLAQIQAAKPTEDWDGRFGTNPAWTPAQFVEALYRTLPTAKRK